MNILTKLNIETKNYGVCFGLNNWHKATNNIIESYNPANKKLIAKVYTGNLANYNQLIYEAKKAKDIWQNWPAPKRGDIIRQIADKLRDNKLELGTLISLEMGKSLQEGLGEVQEMLDIADFAVGQSRMLYGKTMHSERKQHRMYEQWHPYGIIGIFSAFNFPIAVWSWNAFIAAICGNISIWKPSSKTPLCAIAIQKICDRVLIANNAPAIFQLFIPENHHLAEIMLADTNISLISFTGSTNTGRHVATIVAQRLGRSILELGGNNAVILDKTCDLNLAIPAIVFGSIGTSGQRCTTTRRLFIQQEIYEKVCQQLTKAYQQLKIGDPLDQNNHMGPLIDDNAVKVYQQAIIEIKNNGAKILFGGEVINDNYVQPTLVTNIDNNANIVQQETFAPILYILPYDNLATAIAMHNNVRQGLSSAFFSNDLKSSEYFISHGGSDCGIANINISTSGAEIGGAFGGEKDTGGGRESGSDSWKSYMRRQTNTINWSNIMPLAQNIKFDINK